MKKHITTIVIVFLVIISSTISLYLMFGNKKVVVSDAIHAIPTDASFILKINDYHRFTNSLETNNLVWKTLRDFKSVENVNNIIALIDTLSARSGAFNRLISSGQLYISAHITGREGLAFFASVKLPENISKTDVWGVIDDYKNKGLQIKEYRYGDVKILEVGDSLKNTLHCFFAYYNGLVICSSSDIVLETSLRQMEGGGSLYHDSGFVAISQTAGTKVDANLYFNYKSIPVTFRRYFNQKIKGSISTFSDIANWCELDITVNDESISFNGFSQAADSTNSFLKVFARQHPVESKITSVIPTESAAFVSLGISDLDLYLEDYRSYLDRNGRIQGYTSSISKVNKELGVDIHELYRSFFAKEIALVYIPFDGLDSPNYWFIIAQTKGQSQTKQTFKELIENYCKINKLQKSSFKTVYKIDKEKSAEIMRLPQRGINQLLFGSIFSEVSDEFYTFIDDYIVFGASVESLTKIIQSNIHNKQLQLDISYRQFSNLLSSESNYFVYANPGKAEKIYSTFLEPGYSSIMTNHHHIMEKIQGISIQLNGGGNMIFNSICVKYAPSIYDDPQTTWETRLDTAFVMKPQLLINHYTKNREIFVQDLRNKIYLLNDVGRILWTKQIGEQIIGDVSQVDLFKNGKLQFIFNTANLVIAIDRKGEFVAGFPVKLKSKASGPMAVFDYEKNRDYRFFVPCVDKKIYSFNSQGKQISGWIFGKTERVVNNQLQHFRIAGKDYIVFADQNRPYFLDRKGEERIKFSRYFSKSKNSQFVFEASSKNHKDRFVTTDSLGLVRFIYLNGVVEDLGIKPFSSKHFFDYQDIDGDDVNEFVFLEGRQLSVYGQSKNLILSYRFEKDVNPIILYFNFGGSNRKLGFVSKSDNEIYLLNINGSLCDGFPLSGNTLFSIGQLTSKSQFNLFVGSPSGALMNYTVK